MLTDKRLIITGVVRPDSIAWAVAAHAQRAGATVLLTAFPRDYDLTAAAAARLPHPADVLDVDLTRDDDLHRLTDHVRASWGGVDGALHAVGFAPRDALAGDFLEASADSAAMAFRTSAVTYAGLARVVRDLAPTEGGALLGLDFDAAGAWPVYNWMGVCKAALESVNRYLARDLGARRIRSNLIAAGPLHTRAATAIPDFDRLLHAWDTRSPLVWDPTDATPVADTACFLLSDLARAITGEIIHVDGGYHAMAAGLRDTATQHDTTQHDSTPPVTADPDDRRRLTQAFADLREHGVSAHTGLRGDVDQLRTGLRDHLLRRFPAGSGAFAFTTDSDGHSFTPTGALRAPLTVHVSDPTLAALVRHRLAEAGLVVDDAQDPTTLTLAPS